MSDDIVTRIKTAIKMLEKDHIPTAQAFQLCVDEIERLRTELKRWDVCESVFDQLCGWDTEETFCDKCKAVKSGL